MILLLLIEIVIMYLSDFINIEGDLLLIRHGMHDVLMLFLETLDACISAQFMGMLGGACGDVILLVPESP